MISLCEILWWSHLAVECWNNAGKPSTTVMMQCCFKHNCWQLHICLLHYTHEVFFLFLRYCYELCLHLISAVGWECTVGIWSSQKGLLHDHTAVQVCLWGLHDSHCTEKNTTGVCHWVLETYIVYNALAACWSCLFKAWSLNTLICWIGVLTCSL